MDENEISKLGRQIVNSCNDLQPRLAQSFIDEKFKFANKYSFRSSTCVFKQIDSDLCKLHYADELDRVEEMKMSPCDSLKEMQKKFLSLGYQQEVATKCDRGFWRSFSKK